MHAKTEELMPTPIHFSHKILGLMAQDRKSGTLKGIEPDPKVKLQCYMKIINLSRVPLL